jgi:hypothetical protein
MYCKIIWHSEGHGGSQGNLAEWVSMICEGKETGGDESEETAETTATAQN